MLVGILSMQRIINYGSFMQAYGLKKTIESLGNEVHFVDYHPGAVINIQKSIYTTSIRRKIKDRVQMKLFVNLFKSRYLKSLGITSEYNYDTKVDVLVIGSDEVFNCFQSNPDIGYTLESVSYTHLDVYKRQGLLEAMAETNVNLLNDVSFNRYVGGDVAVYFKDENSLKKLIEEVDMMSEKKIRDIGNRSKNRMIEKYSWKKIVTEYSRIFHSI